MPRQPAPLPVQVEEYKKDAVCKTCGRGVEKLAFLAPIPEGTVVSFRERKEREMLLRREIVSDMAKGLRSYEIADRLGISEITVVKLQFKELQVAGPETNLYKAMERQKLGRREIRNNNFAKRWHDTLKTGEALPANVHAAWSKEATAIFEARCKLDPLSTPIRHVIEHEIELKAPILQQVLRDVFDTRPKTSFDFYAAVIDVLTGSHTPVQPLQLGPAQGEAGGGSEEGGTEEEG